MNFTKARVLEMLKKQMKQLNILPVYILQSNDFFDNPSLEIEKIRNEFNTGKLIIRSSSSQEDGMNVSNAGKFQSILNVDINFESINHAIREVYHSYNSNKNEEILIQPMLCDICKSGVVFTADMETLSEYYTVNYFEGNDTAAITSGTTNDVKTFIAYKNKIQDIEDKDMKKLVETCREIENFLENSALDIEFAFVKGGGLYIFQARPIAAGNKDKYIHLNLDNALNRIYKKIEKLSSPHPFLLGQTTCFGVMPDWNPAEILGIRPKKLAISLYKELVTDNVWAHQREDYGYRDLTMHPLMVLFCGIPYIDTRITFNSFIPASLNDHIAEKLVNYYLDRLSKYPSYHDKIEFEIVFSCYYFNLGQQLRKLLDYGFNENELKRIEFSLLEITNKIIHPKKGLYKKDIEKICVLERNYDKIENSNISTIDKIYWLIEECKAYGTLPFAGVARAGFIAVQFLNSMLDSNIICETDYQKFMNSLNTVNKQLSRDLGTLNSGKMSKQEFLRLYGHIRPGTYDILSPCYEEAFDFYFGDELPKSDINCNEFVLSDQQRYKIQMELEQNGLIVSVDELFQFMREAIEGREYLKFVFTKSVSKILQLIEQLGERLQISKEDIANVDIGEIKQLYADLYFDNPAEVLRQNIIKNKQQYVFAQQIKLPSIIVEPKDIYQYFLLEEEPNYITQKTVFSETVSVDMKGNKCVEGKIVFIQSADPGYDYLFSKNIAGLVTQYGGANSHMAIRCAELGIPAIIGAGEKNYNEWKRHKKLKIECSKKKVTFLEA